MNQHVHMFCGKILILDRDISKEIEVLHSTLF